ncbi:MAG: hypothetical protein AAFY98_08245 [Verrucomicrobiota bacterium]
MRYQTVLTIALVLGVCCSFSAFAEEAPEPDAAKVPFSEVYEYGNYDVREIKAALKQVMTDEGKTVFLYDKQKVLIQDDPSAFPMVDAIMKAIIGEQEPQVSGPNIKVEVGFQETSQNRQAGAGVQSRNYGSTSHHSIEVDLMSSRSSSSSRQSQFLVVQSGRSAALTVAREVPVVDFFFSYARNNGLWTGQTRWEKVGTQLVVQPVWKDGLIEVSVWPRITALVGSRAHAIDVRELTTQVTVAEGVRVNIGGFQGRDGRFENYFFGGSRSRQAQSSSFTIKASRATSFPTPR